MGESKLNINSPFKVTVRTANAIFRGGCVTTGRALFIDRRLYVNSDPNRQLAMVGCSAQAEGPIVFSTPQGRKQGRKNKSCFSSSTRMPVCIHSPGSVPVLLASTPYILCILPGSVRCLLQEDTCSRIQMPTAQFAFPVPPVCSFNTGCLHTHTAFFLWPLFCLSDYAAGSRLRLTHVCVLCVWLVLKFGLFTRSLT